jgi:aminocarboxymuconate-semialdehyde decarboxylase
MAIDLHSHYFPLSVAERLPSDLVQHTTGRDGAHALDIAGHHLPLSRHLVDLDQQLADLERQRLTARTLMVPPFTLLYELEARTGARWARAVNEAIAETAATDPDKLIGFATVPLQDVASAVTELSRAVDELGLRGVEIATSVNGDGLDNPGLDPFWTRAEELRIPILIHPHYVSGANRMQDYHLRNLVGNPTETALAGAKLLFGGVLERFPRLHIILSHGGGALPHIIGRLRQGAAVRPECRARAQDPIAGLGKLFYDTIVFDRQVLRHVMSIVGASQLVLGTDYPFDMSEDDPIAFVRDSGLAAAEVDQILNAGQRLIARDA